jgi:hypothetical protein
MLLWSFLPGLIDVFSNACNAGCFCVIENESCCFERAAVGPFRDEEQVTFLNIWNSLFIAFLQSKEQLHPP